MTLKMNICVFSGSNTHFVFAKASVLMKCKIQTMCVKSNIRVSFTPPEVVNEHCQKILYYDHQKFTICQRVVEIRMNDSSKQLEHDLSKVYIQEIGMQPSRDYYSLVIYGYDYSQCIYEVEIYASLSVLQKFEIFIEKMPHDSPIAFICL